MDVPPRPDLLPPPAPETRSRGRRVVRLLVAGGLVVIVGLTAILVVTGPTARSCARTDDLLRRAEATSDAAPSSPSDLRTLLPSSLGEGYRDAGEQVVHDAATIGRERGDAWRVQLQEAGFVAGYRRWWFRLPSGPMIGLQVFDFRTHAGALTFQHWIVHASCTSSSDVFTLDEVAGGIGQHIEWSDGSQSDQISFVRGTRRYLVSVHGNVSPDRALIVEIAGHTMSFAR